MKVKDCEAFDCAWNRRKKGEEYGECDAYGEKGDGGRTEEPHIDSYGRCSKYLPCPGVGGD